MWSYVTHWGNWTSPLGRIPAAFLDVAHKNGVGVSGVASIPNASLSASWAACLKGLAGLDVDKVSKFFQYYGIDGMGYNSEFYGGGAYVKGVRTFHAALVKKMKRLTRYSRTSGMTVQTTSVMFHSTKVSATITRIHSVTVRTCAHHSSSTTTGTVVSSVLL